MSNNKTVHAWAMQADLTTLVGGQEWASRRWSSETLAFYNRAAFAAWVAGSGPMMIEQRVNERGMQHLKAWIEATSLPDHCHTDQSNLEAWAQEAEESMGNGNPPMVEMHASMTVSGTPETFTIPADGVYEQAIDA